MQESLLIALSIGDGHICQNKNKTKAYITIRHSNHQLDYINWKYDLVKDLWVNKPVAYKNLLNGKRYYGHYLRSHLDFKIMDIRNKLYPTGRKTITRDILNKLDPLGLAIWYMDDGCVDRPINKNAMGILNTYCNSPNGEEEIIIQQYFKEVWNINCNLNKSHGRYRIRFPYNEFCKFVEIIKPYVIDSLKYKIDTTMRQNAQTMPQTTAERYSLNFNES